MDLLLLEVLRFGTAILAGGLVAVASVWMTFRRAQQLQRDRESREEASAWRAVSAEVRENIEATRTEHVREGRRPFARVQRSAWDAARALPMSDARFAALAAAYQAGDMYNAAVEMQIFGTPPGGRVHGELNLLQLAPKAHEAFVEALRALS